MSRVKAIVNFIHAWRHPDEIARDVDAELRLHIELRTRANIEGGMKPEEAQLAARASFGDFDSVKARCCEISRSLPVDSRVLRMGTYIAIATIAGAAALWAVNMPHANFAGVTWQLVAIAILARSFIAGRRSISKTRFAGESARGVFITESGRVPQNIVLSSDASEERSLSIASHDDQGCTPIERVFKSE